MLPIHDTDGTVAAFIGRKHPTDTNLQLEWSRSGPAAVRASGMSRWCIMSGLFALLDDVAAMVKLTASSLDDIAAGAGRASIKAAGVVVDDAAVTPAVRAGSQTGA